MNGNSASSGSSGGGIYMNSGALNARNSIVAGNNPGGDLVGSVTSGSNNLIGGNPLLSPLQNNGGPTLTHALLPGSPAINAGDNAFSPGPFDQRGPGFARIVNGTIDIGAFEAQRWILDDGAVDFSATAGFAPLTGQGCQNDLRLAAPGSGSETASETATWTFLGLTTGLYRVSATWVPGANRATNSPFTILTGASPLGTVRINQQLAPNDLSDAGVMWEDLGGPYAVLGTSLTVQLSNDADDSVFADAVRVERLGDLPTGPSYRILDNGDPGFSVTSGWTYLDNQQFGYFQGVQGDVHFVAAGTGSEVATWTFSGLAIGTYRVSTTWTAHPNRATNAPYTVLNGTTVLGTVLINQELAPNDLIDAGTAWEYLGTFTITTGTLVVRLTNDANEFVIADAVRIERLS